jgi:DNA ligase D-like protein (predicted 3'-phosphoesterase)
MALRGELPRWETVMPLKEYRKKRDMRKSPEPSGNEAKVRKDRSSTVRLKFCVQQHDATRLHWDLRLEMEGVLKSWAVPRSDLDPAEKRLWKYGRKLPGYAAFEGDSGRRSTAQDRSSVDSDTGSANRSVRSYRSEAHSPF